MLRSVIAVSLVCSCTYIPDSYRDYQGVFAGRRATLGCLDVAVAVQAGRDLDGVIVDYTVGNRCDRVAAVDLASVVVSSDRAVNALRPFDPLHELRPVAIEARTTAHERIAYEVVVPSSQVCVDISAVAGEVSGPPARPCFEVIP